MSSSTPRLRGVLLATLLLSPALAGSSLTAQSVEREVLLTIAHLNLDCRPDTVYGTLSFPGRSVLPRRIRWGRAPRISHPPVIGSNAPVHPGDTLRRVLDSCSDGIDPARKLEETVILYPPDPPDGSVAFQQMNGDSALEMILYLHWRVRAEGEEHDSLRALILYGQNGLDTNRTLDLTPVLAYHPAPFFAAELVPGEDFVNEGRRELGSRPSWELKRRSTGPRDTKRRDTLTTPEQFLSVSISPNPSGDLALLHAERLPAGRWTVEVIGVEGTVYDRQIVQLAEPGNVLRTVNLRRLANGYYMLRLRNDQGIAGIYPIVVKR